VWGCAALIDLGDEARLRVDMEAGPDTGKPVTNDASTLDARDSATDTGTPLLCGLERSPSTGCAACVEPTCCDVSKECAKDPECLKGIECIKDCMAQLACIFGCLGNANLQALTDCSSSNCNICIAAEKCEALGKCASTFDQTTEQGRLVRSTARALVLELDEEACQKRLESIRNNKLTDASACF
jgi:hypothetical protein